MNRVRVRVPIDGSHLIMASGDPVQVITDEHGRYADVLPHDARVLLFSGFAASIPWLEANLELARRLGPPKHGAGIRIVDIEQSQPRSPFDRAGHVIDTLRSMGKRI